MNQPKIIVHGGAWAIPDDLREGVLQGVRHAANAGFQILKQGKASLDAVEIAVRILEDNPVFDAGRGSCLNAKGQVEMDAVIMNGRTLAAGAVAGIDCVKNPVSLARMVMEKTKHVLLIGEGAKLFAEEMNVEMVGQDYLVTKYAREELENYRKYEKTVGNLFNNKLSGCDTVGAVAIDCHGNIACATSTGGITAKRVGRVGDAPIVGAGAYCDNLGGGVSATGHGESIIRVSLAHQTVGLMKSGETADDACKMALSDMAERVHGAGGLIAISKNGDIGYHFTTERMAWAYASDDLVTSGLDPGDSEVFSMSKL
ncbi:isoaspartyl peptidase/L-asparaginase-like [Artemia franciscana]|uniref:Uncharacterized protein n=1 Tax=Artemia franciscana TaxID=6661 RepID=A0AA88HDV9_ARTSF|nr:hypothetical protein QYM36_015081 [Artemia franciscana]